MSIFAKKLGTAQVKSPLTEIVSEVQSTLNETRQQVNAAGVGKLVALETFSEEQRTELSNVVDNLRGSFTRIAEKIKSTPSFGQESYQASQIESGIASAIMSQNVSNMFSVEVVSAMTTPENTTFVGFEGLQGDAYAKRDTAFEAYDERDNKSVVLNSVVYNLQNGRQNEFGEAFFPTVTVTADQVGVSTTIRLIMTVEDVKRATSGAVTKFNKRNVIRGIIDSTILKNEGTRAIPVVRAESASNFVLPADVAVTAISNEGVAINTAPLAVGKKIDFSAICQTDTMLANGTADYTDALDPAISLKAIYVKVVNGSKTDVLRFNVQGHAFNNFIQTGQDNYRRQNLNFTTDTLLVNKLTKRVDNSALDAMGVVTTNDRIVRLGLDVSGYVNIETGEMIVNANGLRLVSVQDSATGETLAASNADVVAITAALATSSIIGYDVDAWYSNANRANRGQLIDTTYFTQIWAVPYRSPITALRPVTADASSDQADLASLITTTYVRTSNQAVTTLLNTVEQLAQYTDSRAVQTTMPETFGVSRYLIQPTYKSDDIDVVAELASLSSSNKPDDISMLLIQRVREMAYRMFQQSGFQAVVESQAAGVSTKPTVIIGTDITTARYLILNGDTRTLGTEFNYRVVSTSDERMTNRIVVAFGYPEMSDNVVNPLHFGNMIWSPELVAVLPITRNGRISKELTVMPRFRHIVNVPVLGFINVKNLPNAVMSKTPINFKTV